MSRPLEGDNHRPNDTEPVIEDTYTYLLDLISNKNQQISIDNNLTVQIQHGHDFVFGRLHETAVVKSRFRDQQLSDDEDIFNETHIVTTDNKVKSVIIDPNRPIIVADLISSEDDPRLEGKIGREAEVFRDRHNAGAVAKAVYRIRSGVTTPSTGS